MDSPRRQTTSKTSTAERSTTKNQREQSAKKSATKENKRTPIAKLRVRKSLIERTKPAPLVFSSSSDSEDEFSDELGDFEAGKTASQINKTPVKDDTIKPLKNREAEFESLKNWISSTLIEKTPLSVYISGPPGTGKTATTSLVLQLFKKQCLSAHVNCVTTKTQKDLIRAILSACKSDEAATASGLIKCLESLKRPLILILDEVDHLSTGSNSVLYAAFKWPFELSSKLILIGIANSIDLTERVLPKLKLVQAPKRILFTPYTQENIASILEDRMKNDENKLDPKAIELCARKVAAMSGDLRTALLVFKQSKNKIAANALSGNSLPTTGVREVLGVLGNVYSSPISKAKLPLQSELLLAVCLTMSTNKKTPLTVNELFRSYSKACELTNIPELDSDDLSTAFQTLESQSFITVAKNGQIRLQVDAKTARSAISSNGMIEQVKHLSV
ncbi:unnamed protein product [Auanema sp. JU1783]|nr:unnamed protein product [Auanema sp. JU1783]